MRTIILLVLLFQVLETKGNRIHLLACGNFTDRSEIIRSASARDIQDLTLFVEKIASSIGYQTNILTFSNKYSKGTKPFTVNSLLYEIENLQVKPQDILIVGIFGHGNSSNQVSDNFPKIFMGIDDSESIKISILKEKIKAKRAKISVTYVGVCNGNNKENRNTINYTQRQSFKGVNVDRLRPLFLGIRGEIVICSSKKQFVSWSYKEGGISFTYILNNLIGLPS